jgi:hypothetical protein
MKGDDAESGCCLWPESLRCDCDGSVEFATTGHEARETRVASAVPLLRSLRRVGRLTCGRGLGTQVS